jgi:hypothetical protein
MKKLYSTEIATEITDVFTAIGIIAGFYGLMALIVLVAW